MCQGEARVTRSEWCFNTRQLKSNGSGLLTNAPRPLSRPVILVEESKPAVRLTAGLVNEERCHKACNQLKIPSIELGSFSLGIEILWLANGCENGGYNGWVL
ncbi:hypothetical protein PIB30_080303, partial [Stylosanthes scabra]|nr:hypothetical protein [Stylosanthes scabra]